MAGRLRRFLVSAGIGAEESQALMDIYLIAKHLFASQQVDFTIDSSEARLGPLEILHVPGHCPGQIVMRVDSCC
jgi:glyoxylase-like metal-dependent hydrolase (beta-lactamase superfamily II)